MSFKNQGLVKFFYLGLHKTEQLHVTLLGLTGPSHNFSHQFHSIPNIYSTKVTHGFVVCFLKHQEQKLSTTSAVE